MERRQQVLGGAVLWDSNRILLIQRGSQEETLPGVWEFPSGKKEPAERLAQTVVRECFEETGVAVRILSLLDYLEYGVGSHQMIRDCLQLNLLCVPASGAVVVRLSSEHQAYRWVGEDEIDLIQDAKRRETMRLAFERMRGS